MLLDFLAWCNERRKEPDNIEKKKDRNFFSHWCSQSQRRLACNGGFPGAYILQSKEPTRLWMRHSPHRCQLPSSTPTRHYQPRCIIIAHLQPDPCHRVSLPCSAITTVSVTLRENGGCRVVGEEVKGE